MAEGWDDIFLDLDPDRGIVAGERWERALNEAANRCEAVLFLVSKAWLGSDWCRKEFHLAQRLNKRLFGVLIEDIAVGELPADLTGRPGSWSTSPPARDHKMFRATLPITGEEVHVTFSTAGLMRLKTGLQRAGLDARFFAWPPRDDPDRPPYRGLRPLEAEDAGIFFGREAPIVDALDRAARLARGGAAALPRHSRRIGRGQVLVPPRRPDAAAATRRPQLSAAADRPARACRARRARPGSSRCLETALKSQGLARTRAELKAIVGGGAEAVLPRARSAGGEGRIPALMDETETQAADARSCRSTRARSCSSAEGAEEAAALLALLRDLLLATARRTSSCS